ncbi:MAG: hypothetical protein Q9205_000666 [Flavoplaca limonia]
MTSSVFFRFKSQKEPTRVAFDGTGISVFELKREIILSNRLGDGSDFELIISSEDTGEEYGDDTHLIPRSTAVIAKRLPALKPGRGSAARYVSGKMPQNAKNLHRTELAAGAAGTASRKAEAPRGLSEMNGAQTEEEKIRAMYRLEADQWAQQQQVLANATPVHRSGPSKSKQVSGPDRPPPPGYVCYRCGEKDPIAQFVAGHWIQACPTNDDPAHVNRPRVKRTTGIPRSFLKTVERPTAIANDGTMDDTKQPAGVMINAEGDWVVAEPDQASWDQYQARTKVSTAAQEEAVHGDKALQEKGLECPIDKRLFIEPAYTPCCKKTYCMECITNTLLDNDLKCPHCAAENVPVDDLVPDEEMAKRVREHEREHEQDQKARLTMVAANSANKKPHDRDNAPNPSPEEDAGGTSKPVLDASPKTAHTVKPSGDSAAAVSKASVSKKRPAETLLNNPRILSGQGAQPSRVSSEMAPNVSLSTSTGPMGQPVPANMFNIPMSMMAPVPMGSGGYNAMTMPNSFMGGGSSINWQGMWPGGFPQLPLDTGGAGFSNGGANGQLMANNTHVPLHNGYMGQSGTGVSGYGRGSFPNQQRNHFAGSKANEEDSAYFRKPVNPHRHQARRNVNRPTDYREI